jgi:anthranilate/para-aminobenzoate synthase component I
MPFEGDSWDLYLKLRISNPAPFSAYMTIPGLCVLSASPELFLSLDGNQVETRPIKGTRPRGGDPLEDERLAGELVASAKDRAENIMIVDLMRNDLGKVCEVGSVEVSGLTRLEKHPTVWHLVSTINGSLEGHYGPVDLLRSCFPGGSITGAPKIRAMEIIEEIEPIRRGIYCGSMGYIAFNGNMRTSIAIRTMTLENNEISFHSGGGIVADSDPWSEYLETIDKAKGLMKALSNGSDSVSQWSSISGEWSNDLNP